MTAQSRAHGLRRIRTATGGFVIAAITGSLVVSGLAYAATQQARSGNAANVSDSTNQRTGDGQEHHSFLGDDDNEREDGGSSGTQQQQTQPNQQQNTGGITGTWQPPHVTSGGS